MMRTTRGIPLRRRRLFRRFNRRLLDDVRSRKIDVIVVYKVDRLTRSLADFAKLVELFDAHDVSFVSVTQQFNTTTSMGRLTLNVLLSFATFCPSGPSERRQRRGRLDRHQHQRRAAQQDQGPELVAISQKDPSKVTTVFPFGQLEPDQVSFAPPKTGSDADNSMVYAQDLGVGKVAGMKPDQKTGELKTIFVVDDRTSCLVALRALGNHGLSKCTSGPASH
jgi:hypothetical protein